MTDREGAVSKVRHEGARGETLASHCWSPDGKQIAAISRNNANSTSAIVVIDGDGGKPAQRLAPPKGNRSKEPAGFTIDWR